MKGKDIFTQRRVRRLVSLKRILQVNRTVRSFCMSNILLRTSRHILGSWSSAEVE